MLELIRKTETTNQGQLKEELKEVEAKMDLYESKVNKMRLER
jgi:hypothetical protein